MTLTYTEETLPRLTGSVTGSDLPTLRPKDLQDWLKRFREAISPLKIRFYGVGEYGDKTERPHYHVIIFGFPNCRRGRTKRKFGTTSPDPENCCDRCRLVHKTWGLGNIEIGEVNPASASYISEYTVKKMTRFDDTRLHGRHPEFSRMSRQNGGIGSDAMWQVASDLMKYGLDARSDVPTALANGRRILPLGRYLVAKLRERVGRDAKAPPETIQKMAAALQPLRDFAFDNSLSLKKVIAEASEQPALNLETKNNIFKSRKNI